MAHHEDSHNDHAHDNTEGSRQYYPKGWFIPLVGLFVVAFAFSLGAGALLGISGSDKWGNKECSEMKDGEHHTKADGEEHHTGTTGTTEAVDNHNNDSVNITVAPASDCVHVDTAKIEPVHK